MGELGRILWFTGLSGSGKTTIASLVEQRLKHISDLRVQRLDGDILREVMNHDLGFSKEDRFTHIQRVVFIANLLAQHGVMVLASCITPYHEMRDYCRQQLPSYVEVYVKCPIEKCIERDVKGLYERALAGKIEKFTGISDPYEEPIHPDLIIPSAIESPKESAERVIRFLKEKRQGESG